MRLVSRILIAVFLVGFSVLSVFVCELNSIAAMNFVGAFVLVYCGIFVLKKDLRSPLNRSSFYICLCAAMHVAEIGLAYTGPRLGIETIKVGFQMLSNGSFFLVPAIFLFIHRLAESRSSLTYVLTWAALASILPFVALNAAGTFTTDITLLGNKYIPVTNAYREGFASVVGFWLLVLVVLTAIWVVRSRRPDLPKGVRTDENTAGRERRDVADMGAAISSINHEVSNILSPVGYYLNRAEKASEPGEVQKAISTIRQRMEMLNDLSRDLRDYYKEPSLSPRSVLLKTVVESVLSDLAGLVGSGWSPPGLQGLDISLQADPQRLKQILHNILKNAWEAMSESTVKTWQVQAEVSAPVAIVTVSDSGCGIAPEVLPHIFEPFFTTKKERGTGLGLAIVRRITEAHGANIAVDSTPGKGTTVTLTWPLASAAET